MQLWFSRSSEVPIRDQLVTQIILGILSGDLAPGERLPSTRELARRFHLHPNTASAGYRKLEREHWVELRHGSGVYVRRKDPAAPLAPDVALDQIVATMFQSARKLGVSSATLRTRLRRWLAAQPPDHFVLIEPDPALRQIVLAEMRQVITLPITVAETPTQVPKPASDPEHKGLQNPPGKPAAEVQLISDPSTPLAAMTEAAIAVVLPSKAEIISPLLPPETELVVLQVHSIRSSLAKYLPAPADALVAVASGWPGFLTLAHTMLVAAGFHPDSIILRDSTQPDWRSGLSPAAAIICDTLTTANLAPDRTVKSKSLPAKLPNRPPILTFQLLTESSLNDLRRCEHHILQSHLTKPDH